MDRNLLFLCALLLSFTFALANANANANVGMFVLHVFVCADVMVDSHSVEKCRTFREQFLPASYDARTGRYML